MLARIFRRDDKLEFSYFPFLPLPENVDRIGNKTMCRSFNRETSEISPEKRDELMLASRISSNLLYDWMCVPIYSTRVLRCSF